MKLLLVTILYLVPPSLGIVDCITACKRCQERDEKHPEILEVYCSMCQECIDRQRERRLRSPERQATFYNAKDVPDDCPPPPPCEDIDEYPPALAESTLVTPSTTTTQATTRATTRRPCPPPPPCKRRPSPCFYPCMPMCPCPYPQHSPPYTSTVVTLAESAHHYVYVGVPKGLYSKLNKK